MGGVRLGVVNTAATCTCVRAAPPSREIEVALGRSALTTSLFSLHAEAAASERSPSAGTSMGRVTAVVGTHTHVPTADARVVPGGTAHNITMSIRCHRVDRSMAIESLLTQMPVRFQTSTEGPWLMGRASFWQRLRVVLQSVVMMFVRRVRTRRVAEYPDQGGLTSGKNHVM